MAVLPDPCRWDLPDLEAALPGEDVVAMSCGVVSTTAPEVGEAVTWFVVPVTVLTWVPVSRSQTVPVHTQDWVPEVKMSLMVGVLGKLIAIVTP